MNIQGISSRNRQATQHHLPQRRGSQQQQQAPAESDIHFSSEATLLLELINRHGDIQQQFKPWYFRNAFMDNAELALQTSSQLVERAAQLGVHMDLNFVFEEVKRFNQLRLPQQEHLSDARRLLQRAPRFNFDFSRFVPSQVLNDKEKQILEWLHQFCLQRGFATSNVSDFALLFALEKHCARQQNVQLNSLDAATAKNLVDKYLSVLLPDFVYVLIDFYKQNKSRLLQLATTSTLR